MLHCSVFYGYGGLEIERELTLPVLMLKLKCRSGPVSLIKCFFESTTDGEWKKSQVLALDVLYDSRFMKTIYSS